MAIPSSIGSIAVESQSNRVLSVVHVTQQRPLTIARVVMDQQIRLKQDRRETLRAHTQHLANEVIRRTGSDESRCFERAGTIAT